MCGGGLDMEDEPEGEDDWRIPAVYAVDAVKEVLPGAKAALRKAVQETCERVAGSAAPLNNELHHTVVAHAFFSAAPRGVVLVELCGGACTPHLPELLQNSFKGIVRKTFESCKLFK